MPPSIDAPIAAASSRPSSVSASQALFDAAARVTRHHAGKLDARLRRAQAEGAARPGATSGRRDKA